MTKEGGGGQKSPILRRHSLWTAPYDFDVYYVNVKTIRQIAQIFVAFSEKLNFTCYCIIILPLTLFFSVKHTENKKAKVEGPSLQLPQGTHFHNESFPIVISYPLQFHVRACVKSGSLPTNLVTRLTLDGDSCNITTNVHYLTISLF